MEESQIIEIWDVFKEYVPEKSKDIAASHYVDYLVGQDVESSILSSLVGYDPHLDDAIELVLDSSDTDSNIDGDEEDHYEEDEDR